MDGYTNAFQRRITTICYIFFYEFKKKMFLMFIDFSDRGRQSASGGAAERERGRHNLKQAPGSELSAQSPMQGSSPQTLRSWPEPKSDT